MEEENWDDVETNIQITDHQAITIGESSGHDEIITQTAFNLQDMNVGSVDKTGFGSRPGSGFNKMRGFGNAGGDTNSFGSNNNNDDDERSDGKVGFGASRKPKGGFGDRESNGNHTGGCFKCGRSGHFARECPDAEASEGRSNGGFDRKNNGRGGFGSNRQNNNEDSNGGGGGFRDRGRKFGNNNDNSESDGFRGNKFGQRNENGGGFDGQKDDGNCGGRFGNRGGGFGRRNDGNDDNGFVSKGNGGDGFGVGRDNSGGGFGGGKDNSGFGGGRDNGGGGFRGGRDNGGGGFRERNNNEDSNNRGFKQGGNVGGGFGKRDNDSNGKQSNGFGRPSKDFEDDAGGKRGGGFGTKRREGDGFSGGGFGQRGFGQSSQSGSQQFGESSNKGGGSKGCFKCGGDHLARDCTEPGSRPQKSGGDGCFKCGGDHFARECTNPDTRQNGGGSKGCFKCGGDHLARDCTEPDTRQNGVDGKKPAATYVPPEPTSNEDEMFQSIHMGINFDKYDDIPVECTGVNPPKEPITRFEDSSIHDILKENVIRSKYDRPTPIQKWSIPTILLGRDLMGCAQTGSGKTAGFLLPVLTSMLQNGISGSFFSEKQEPQAIVVGPTRELVSQIYNETRKFSVHTTIRPVVLYGGVSVSHQYREVQKGAHIIIATPGRLLHFITKGWIGLAKVKYLVLDEADRMLDMGFKGDIMALCNDLGMPDKFNRQTLMFSATFPQAIQEIAHHLLHDYIFITVGMVGGANQDIVQNIVLVENRDKREKLLNILKAQKPEERTLIFVEKKKVTDVLALYLCQYNLPATSIHGDREQREREEALAAFKSGVAPILVATSVASRGLDIPGVSHVINYDLPASIDEYVHRIGRTGRCGNIGQATSFYEPSSDNQLARELVKILANAHQDVPLWLEEMSNTSSGMGGFAGMSEERFDLRRNESNQKKDDFLDNQPPQVNNIAAPVTVDLEDEVWE